MFRISEETKERLAAIIELSRITLHYTYIPLIVYLGYTRSNPKPDLLRYIIPFNNANTDYSAHYRNNTTTRNPQCRNFHSSLDAA